MLKYYVKRSADESYQKVTTPPRSHVWIHGDAVDETDVRLLARSYGMNLNILRDIMDENELPRVELQDGGLYVFVRTVLRNKRNMVVTTPILLAVKGSVFVNLSMAATTDHKLATPSVIAQSKDTTSLLLGTFAAVVSEYEALMQHAAQYIHDTSRRLRTHEVTNDDFIEFVTVEDNLNEYYMNLGGMLVVAERLKEVLQNSQDAEALEDILLYIRQLVVAIKSHNQSITSIRNAYQTVANTVLNQRMKTLTVLTVLIALPNVFFGMYGMNVALPFQDQPWVYGVILSFSVLVIILVFAIARKRGIF
jgi:magnesium transporter